MPKSDPEELPRRYQSPALDKILTALRVSGWRSPHKRHGAAADAVKVLAVASGLLCGATLHELVESKFKGLSVLCKLPSPNYTWHCGKEHRFTARIRAADGSKLPLQTTIGLKRLYQHRGLRGVGLNARNDNLARDRVHVWWLSFRSQEVSDFIAKVDGSTFNGTVLCVKVTESAPTTKKQWEPVNSKSP